MMPIQARMTTTTTITTIQPITPMDRLRPARGLTNPQSELRLRTPRDVTPTGPTRGQSLAVLGSRDMQGRFATWAGPGGKFRATTFRGASYDSVLCARSRGGVSRSLPAPHIQIERSWARVSLEDGRTIAVGQRRTRCARHPMAPRGGSARGPVLCASESARPQRGRPRSSGRAVEDWSHRLGGRPVASTGAEGILGAPRTPDHCRVGELPLFPTVSFDKLESPGPCRPRARFDRSAGPEALGSDVRLHAPTRFATQHLLRRGLQVREHGTDAHPLRIRR